MLERPCEVILSSQHVIHCSSFLSVWNTRTTGCVWPTFPRSISTDHKLCAATQEITKSTTLFKGRNTVLNKNRLNIWSSIHPPPPKKPHTLLNKYKIIYIHIYIFINSAFYTLCFPWSPERKHGQLSWQGGLYLCCHSTAITYSVCDVNSGMGLSNNK